MSKVVSAPATLIPGTTVQASFPSFSGQFPELYETAQKSSLNLASLNLASLNAGNSDTLCVGLGGVNYGFYEVLSKAGQKNANLNTQPASGNYKPCAATSASAAADDYQGRHLNLLAKAAASGFAWESYSNTDPCCFSYVHARQRTGAPGREGICFIDVFDPKLCPAGDSKNAAMVYVIPPNGSDYTQKSDFLGAIEHTATTIIVCIADYNTIAASRGLPAIEALRKHAFQLGNYSFAGVSSDEIARAIFAGFVAGFKVHPKTGLQELQFPVHTGNSRLFEAVEADLTATPATQPGQQPGPQPGPGGGAHQARRVAGGRLRARRRVMVPMMEPGEGEEGSDEEGSEDENDIEMAEVDSNGAPVGKVTADGKPVDTQAKAVGTAADQDRQLLQQRQPPQNYGRLPQPRYAAANSPLVAESRGRVFGDASNIYGKVTLHDEIAADPNPMTAPPSDRQNKPRQPSMPSATPVTRCWTLRT